MRISLRAALFAFVFAFPMVLLSCDGQAPSEPVTQLDAVTAQFDAHNGGHVVTGKGTLWVPEPSNNWINIAFNVVQGPDGQVHGLWHHQFRSRRSRGRIMVEVGCMSVSGNEAWFAGRAVQAGAEGNIGRYFGLRVIDNGEGANAPPDEMTRTVWFQYDPQVAWDFCSNMPTDSPVWPLDGGNVQVR
jgi:hypothetical protein